MAFPDHPWLSLGCDVCDEGFLSVLATIGGVVPETLRDRTFAATGLLSSADAHELKDIANDVANEHAPFSVYRVSLASASYLLSLLPGSSAGP